jgi:hypothetical protein
MPPAIIPAVVATAGAAASAYVAGTAITTAFLIKTFAVNLLLTAAQGSLKPDNSLSNIGGGGAGASNFGQSKTVSVRSSNSTRRLVYGETRVGGTIVFIEATDDDEFLHIVVVLAAHEIQSVESVFFGEKELTLSGNSVTAPSEFVGVAEVYPVTVGSVANIPAPLLATPSWTTSHVLEGQAYVYCKLKYDNNAYPDGLPNISALVRGRKVLDTRTSTTAFSYNPAMVIRDYLTDTVYGLGASATEIDDTSFNAAANICEESVTLAAGGSEDRYTFNGVLDTGNTPRSNIEQMLSALGGSLYYSNGKWHLKAGAYVTPTVTLDENDIVGSISVGTAVSNRESFNAVKGQFATADTNFQATDYPEVSSSTFETEDGGEKKYLNYNLPFTTSSPTAQRLARQVLFKNRQEISVSAKFKLTAFQFAVGDTLMLTNSRLGWSQKVFEVVGWQLDFDKNEVGVQCKLAETASGVYDWNANESAFANDNTNLPSALNLPAPTLSVSDEAQVVNQKVTSVLVATPTSTSQYADLFEVQAKKATDTNYISLGISSSPRFELHNVIANTLYDVRARIISNLGIKSAFASVQYTIGSTPATISDVTNFSVNVNGQNADLSWTPVIDQSLSHYIIRHSPLTTGASYGNAKTVAAKVSRPASTLTVPAQTGTYFIKAVDKLGGTSATADESIVLVSALQGFQNVSTIDEHPDFGGTKTDVIIVDNKLQLDTADLFDDPAGNFDDAVGLFDGGNASVVSSGTYEFEDYIDLGAVYTAQATYTLKVNQLSQITGATTNVGATDVDIFVSTTDDDPAGTPTWSAYRQFIVGSYTARAFRFKAVLSTTQSDETPSIEELTIDINMANSTQSENDLQSGTAAGGKVITFPVAFKTLQAVAISVGDMQSGDFYAITSKSATGFTIVFKDSSNTVVDRLFDYVATGV